MNEAAHVIRLPHQRDADIGRLARSWESDILDLRDMALVTCAIADHTLSDADPKPTANEVRQMLFCIYEMNKKIDRFCDAFYAAVELK